MFNRVEVDSHDTVVYKGLEFDPSVLEAVADANKRVLWAFIRGEAGAVRAVPYDETRVIWMTEADVLKEQDVEI